MLFANDMAIQLLELDPDRLAKKSYWVLDLFTEEENPLFHRLFTSFVSGEMENLNILSVHTTLVSVRSRTPLSGLGTLPAVRWRGRGLSPLPCSTNMLQSAPLPLPLLPPQASCPCDPSPPQILPTHTGQSCSSCRACTPRSPPLLKKSPRPRLDPLPSATPNLFLLPFPKRPPHSLFLLMHIGMLGWAPLLPPSLYQRPRDCKRASAGLRWTEADSCSSISELTHFNLTHIPTHKANTPIETEMPLPRSSASGWVCFLTDTDTTLT